jgi:hypothetical protein
LAPEFGTRLVDTKVGKLSSVGARSAGTRIGRGSGRGRGFGRGRGRGGGWGGTRLALGIVYESEMYSLRLALQCSKQSAYSH